MYTEFPLDTREYIENSVTQYLERWHYSVRKVTYKNIKETLPERLLSNAMMYYIKKWIENMPKWHGFFEDKEFSNDLYLAVSSIECVDYVNYISKSYGDYQYFLDYEDSKIGPLYLWDLGYKIIVLTRDGYRWVESVHVLYTDYETFLSSVMREEGE